MACTLVSKLRIRKEELGVVVDLPPAWSCCRFATPAPLQQPCASTHTSARLPLPCVDSAQLLDLYKDFCSKYPIVSIEDPFEQDDWDPATQLTAEGICQVRTREREG